MNPPNILIVFTDMQRADTVRALGNDVIRTPHLDRLVREGTAFTNAFSPSPVCVPAPYLLFTKANGRVETVSDEGGTLDWKRYPRVDEEYLKDSDAGLLFQDHPSYALDLPGYHEKRPMRGGRV